MDLIRHKSLRRRTEDYDYWKARAGWFDDDVSMKEFNSGVYDTYYQLDDDAAAAKRAKSNTSVVGANSKGLATFLKIGAAVVAVIFAILVFRALSRRSPASSRKVGSSSKTKEESKSRPHSRSRSSGRSRSRSRRASSSANYEIMDDQKSEARSKRSSRSRSRSRRQSKGGKSRSRSKSRQKQNKEVLV
jgi:hypothetical protein